MGIFIPTKTKLLAVLAEAFLIGPTVIKMCRFSVFVKNLLFFIGPPKFEARIIKNIQCCNILIDILILRG